MSPRTPTRSSRRTCWGLVALLLPMGSAPVFATERARPTIAALAQSSRRSWTSLRRELKASMSEREWSEFKAEPIAPHPLRGRWNGEDQPGYVKDGRARPQIEYLHEATERERYALRVRSDGKIYDRAGAPFDTRGAEAPAIADLESGSVYARAIHDKKTSDSFKHSSFTAGKPVAMAFEATFDVGTPRLLKNRSGHYRPARREFIKWLLAWERAGVDLSRTDVEFDPKSN